jgi:MerR family mercuric resistance operon transcriptional regulator
VGSDSIPESGFLFIGELAKLTGADPKTIRFYERAELLSPPRHGRFRTYQASDVRRLKNVLALRKLGVPIAQIRMLFEVVGGESDVLASSESASMLRRHLDSLRNKLIEINQQIATTAKVLDRFAA